MATFRYRKRSGQVDIMTELSGGVIETPFFGKAVDPANVPDGTDRPPEKIYLIGTDTLRNATSGEIEGFASAIAEDNNLIERERAIAMLDGAASGVTGSLANRKFHRSLGEALLREINILRGWNSELRENILTATSFAQVQDAVSSMSNLPDRTPAQARQEIRDLIHSGVND